MKRISVVMLNWKRPENVIKIVTHLKKNDLVDDIVIWNNNPEEKLLLPEPINNVRVINMNHNLGLAARWHAMLLAEHDAIYVQDDDLILSNQAIQKLYEEWEKDPDVIHGIWGGVPRLRDYCYDTTRIWPEVEYVLMGLSIVHKKYALEVLKQAHIASEYIKSTIKKNGEDIFMSYVVMSLTGRKNKTHDFRDQIEDLPAPYALSTLPDHYKVRTDIMRACRKEFHIKFSVKEAALVIRYRLAAYLESAHPHLYLMLKKVKNVFLGANCRS